MPCLSKEYMVEMFDIGSVGRARKEEEDMENLVIAEKNMFGPSTDFS